MEEMLSYDKKKIRAAILEKMIKVAIECKNICNFNDCVNIISTLNNFVIKSMTKTWLVMDQECCKWLEQLNSLLLI